tara:strand:- start:9991 stop:10197 length:207 start_codon:yes stop_codon:yes gene_type:complete
MMRSNNPASWQYRMDLPRPGCCENLNKTFQHGPSSFWAFRTYVKRKNLDRAKLGVFLKDTYVPLFLSP